MPNFVSWYEYQGEISVSVRALRSESRIKRDPFEVVIYRDGVELPAQTVRVVMELNSVKRDSDVTLAEIHDGLLFGVKDHPDLADTDVQTGDRFQYEGQEMNVVKVIQRPGEIQAYLELFS